MEMLILTAASWGRQRARTSMVASAALPHRLPLEAVRQRRRAAKRAARRVTRDWRTAATPEIHAGRDDRFFPSFRWVSK